jgi:Domain of unknown function (DUF4397)
MNRFRFFSCCVLAVAVGCKKDATFTEPQPLQAAVHWLEDVPDTGQMDMRPVDIISNAALMNADFRGSNTYYQGIDAGSRRIRVFMSSSNPAITGVPVLDTVVTFASPNLYTVIHTGFARTGSAPGRSLWVIQDADADPGAGNIAVRIVNAGVGMATAVDVNLLRHASDTLPDAPKVGNIAYKGVGTYLVFARDSVATDSLRVVVTATGTKTPVLFTLKLPRGVPGDTISNNPIAGASVAGSVITAVIVPRSVAGSTAPQTAAFTVPSAVFFVDRRPPNTVKTR